MATIYTYQSRNVMKTWLLMGIFLIVVTGLGYVFSQIYGNPSIFYFAIILSVVMNIVSYWNSDKIALSLSGAKLATKEEYYDFYTIAENLAITAGLPTPKLYVINDPAPNAFATGRNKDHAAIAATTGLLQILNRKELEGVVAHEMSHIGNRDTLLMTSVVVLVGLVSILSDMFLRTRWLNMGGGRRNDSEGGNILMLAGIVLAILSPIIATLIQLAISRKREYLADASGALLTRYPEGLAEALEKISGNAQPMQRAFNATAHLFIESPFGSKDEENPKRGWFTNLFMTHPPIEERIKILRGMET